MRFFSIQIECSCTLYCNSMAQLRQETEKSDADIKKKEIEIKNPGHGYGGKFGIEKDRMDKSAVGHDYIGKGKMIQYLPCSWYMLPKTMPLLFTNYQKLFKCVSLVQSSSSKYHLLHLDFQIQLV